MGLIMDKLEQEFYYYRWLFQLQVIGPLAVMILVVWIVYYFTHKHKRNGKETNKRDI